LCSRNFVRNAKGQLLRKGLVVFQFAIAFVIMVGTYIIYSQLDFMLNKNMASTGNKTLIMRLPQDSIGDLALKNEMLQLAGVEAVTRMAKCLERWYGPADSGMKEPLKTKPRTSIIFPVMWTY